MGDGDGELRKKIMAIQSNPELTPQQKGHAMQALMSSKWDAANGSGGVFPHLFRLHAARPSDNSKRLYF